MGKASWDARVTGLGPRDVPENERGAEFWGLLTQLQIRRLQQQDPTLTSDTGGIDHAKMRPLIYNISINAFQEVGHSYISNQYILLFLKNK